MNINFENISAEILVTVISTLLAAVSALIAFISVRQSKKLVDLSKPHLEFHLSGSRSYFRGNRPEEKMYHKSKCLSFVFVSISNYSNLPITIRQFELHVPGYPQSFCNSSTRICLEKYILIEGGNKSLQIADGVYISCKPDPTHQIDSKDFILMPLTLEPYGYRQGYLLFPYCPLFEELSHDAKIKVLTTRGNFDYSLELFPVSVILDEENLD